MEQKNVKINDLKLWDENARLSDKYFNKTEKELIGHFLNKKEFKIEILAKEIVKDFDLPQLEKVIVYDDGEQNIVLEGNRRLVVYKLLLDPNLTDDEHIRQKFKELKKSININESYSLECLVSTKEAECYRYIKRKHLNGNNEVQRGDQERAHHKVRSGNANEKEKFKIEIAKVIKKLDIPEILKEQILGPGYVTNFRRILDSSAARKEYGFKIMPNGELTISDPAFNKKLKTIIWNVLQKKDLSGNKIDSRALNTNFQKEVYLKSITTEDEEKTAIEIKKAQTTDLFGKSAISTRQTLKGKIRPKSTSRKYLIPKICYLDINENKIHNIYRELRDNLLLDDSNDAVPNAVAVLFRVFLEISVDYFWEKKKGETFIKDTKLDGKITKVSEFMEKNSLAKKNQLTNIRAVATAKDSILAIENFHRYVHSYKTQPSSSDLKSKWDNLEEFFVILWQSLENKKKK